MRVNVYSRKTLIILSILIGIVGGYLGVEYLFLSPFLRSIPILDIILFPFSYTAFLITELSPSLDFIIPLNILIDIMSIFILVSSFTQILKLSNKLFFRKFKLFRNIHFVKLMVTFGIVIICLSVLLILAFPPLKQVGATVEEVTVSPDKSTKTIVYESLNGYRFAVISNGQTGKTSVGKSYESITGVAYTSTGHVGYIGELHNKYFLIIDNIFESSPYTLIYDYYISPDGKHTAIEATSDRYGGPGEFLSWDGKTQNKYNFINNVTFSPDSQHIAYLGDDGKENLLIVDGIVGIHQQNTGIVFGGFSKDSQKILYILESGDPYNPINKYFSENVATFTGIGQPISKKQYTNELQN